ncbi:hypothetical protein HMPREF1982_03950 [Clostridiales bacterium oral taxon 876 str. F0540]|nr:hypothetical protein HMPREF1982_03950 [Clostridiales bacterium oral taxon 876 str. F0540]
MIEKNSYVEIVQEILSSEDRASNIPEDTKETSLKLWAKGWLIEDSKIGEIAQIRTITGRVLEGVLTEVNPSYEHGFGDFIPEVSYIGLQAKSILWGDNIE